MKTPDEMAEEYANSEGSGDETYGHGLRQGFLAGYQAAMEDLGDQLKSLLEQIAELKADLREMD